MSDNKQKIEGPVIGIDLGTCYSCCAIYRNSKVEIIANDQGNRTTPSYVAFTDSEILVGDSAKNQAPLNPQNTVFDAKRLIGKKFSDPSVQKNLKHFPFNVRSGSAGGETDKAMIRVEYKGKDKDFTPEEVSAQVLKKMKEIAETFLGEPVKHAVVTVPAYFNDEQRNATMLAGRIAGLNILRIINEPTAAAMAYAFDTDKSATILIFDLGGGTFDCSVLEVDDGVYQVKATAGDNNLGGEDLDNKVCEFLLGEFCKQNKFTQSELAENYRAKRRLKTACERAKRTLSSSYTVKIEIDSFYNGKDFNFDLTRAKFESLCHSEFEKCLGPVMQVLKDSGKSKSNIDEIVLVGGSTRIPKIQEMLSKFFNGKTLKKSVNPDEAVAYGAAIQANILSGKQDKKTEKILLIDVNPLSLGIETAGGVMTTIVPRNTTIPCKKEKDNFSTFEDNQENVTIQVYEGESGLTRGNRLLGRFNLKVPTGMKRGEPQITVAFNVDANGVLAVTAQEKSSGNAEEIKIENKIGKLSEAEVQTMIDEAKKNEDEDRKVLDRITAKNKLDNAVYQLKEILSSKKSEMSNESGENLENLYTEMNEWLANSRDNTTTEEFEERFNDLMRRQSEITNSGENNDANTDSGDAYSGPKVEEVD